MSITLWSIEDALVELLDARQQLIEEIEHPEPAAAPTPELRAQVAEYMAREKRAELAEVEKALAEYVGREIQKVDGIHAYLKWADATAKAAKEEAAAYAARCKRAEAARDRLKALVVDVMRATGKRRLEGTAGRVLRVQANGGLAPLEVDGDVLPDEYIDITVRLPLTEWRGLTEKCYPTASARILTYAPATERIREALAEGPVPGAHLGERGEHLRLG